MSRQALTWAMVAVTLLFSACGWQTERTTAEQTPVYEPYDRPAVSNQFWLDEVPELEPYQSPEEIVSRWYREYTTELLPRDDYGQLYTYPARRLTDNIGPNYLYGLCDGAGRIVTDDAYVRVESCYRPDGTQLLSLERQPATGASEEEIAQRWQVAAADGSWLLTDLPGGLRYADETWLVLMAWDTGNWDFGEGSIYIYDYEGNLHAAYSPAILSNYADGRLLLYFYDENNDNWGQKALIHDMEGADSFPVQDEESKLWGLKDSAGAYIIQPAYASADELYAGLGFGPEEERDDRRWEDIEIDGETYRIYSYENGRYSVFSDYRGGATGDYAGLLTEDLEWLLKIRIRENV